MTSWLGRTLVSGPFLSLCLSEAEYLARMKYLGMDDLSSPWLNRNCKANTHTFAHPVSGELCALVCLSPDLKRTDQIAVFSTLVHEAVHVWQRYRMAVGEDDPGLEMEAYAIESIARTLIREYVARRLALKKKKRRSRR